MASFYPKHESWKHDIENSSFVYDLERTIEYALRNNQFERNRCLKLSQELSREIQGKDSTLYISTLVGHEASKSFAKPVVDLNLGLRASFVVSKSVLSPRSSPRLDAELSQVLAEHEVLLRNAEAWLSNKVIELAKKREDLRKQKVTSPGTASKIRNWFLGIRVEIKDLQISQKSQEYNSREHLKKVARGYENATNRTVNPYAGWYNFQVPRLNFELAKRELLLVKNVANYFAVEQETIRGLLRKNNFVSYHVRNEECIKRSELNIVLNQLPTNNFKEYPK